MPLIPSLSEYEDCWISWWKGLQPPWRNTGNWPLLQSHSTVDAWDKLLVGGKDGIFVVVMALSWWISKTKQGTSESQKLTEAVADVSWVLSHLVSALSAKTPKLQLSTSSGELYLPPVKIGPPPKKRARRVQS